MSKASNAVVIGAGMGGLLAALVLREFHDRVTVLERDSLESETEARGGVPQGRHIHALLARGTQVLDELLPGMTKELIAGGVPTGDVLSDARWYYDGHRLHPSQVGLAGLMITRPHLEGEVRRRVTALPGIEIRASSSVSGLELTPDGRKVRSVRVHEGQDLPADLVVDASGRGSHLPEWLAESGFQKPIEERVKVDLGYATAWFDLPADALGTDNGIVVGATAELQRAAGMGRMADGRWLVSLAGYLGDHPPVDRDGFVEFAAGLPSPEIHELLKDAEPSGGIVRYRFPHAVRRRYEKLDRFPEGLVVLGDAVASFNPIYGQGMSVAADQVLSLRGHLRAGTGSVSGFRGLAAHSSAAAWDMSVAGDLRIPGVEGERTALIRFSNAYTARICRAAETDPAVAREFVRVANLVDAPAKLFHPGIALRVLKSGGVRPGTGRRSGGGSG